MPSGTQIDEPIGFPAYGVSVDNNTGQWVELPDVGRFVAPNTSRQISLNGKQGARALFRAPPGKTQPVAIPTEECILVFTSERLQTTGAQVPSVLTSVAVSNSVRARGIAQAIADDGLWHALAFTAELYDNGNMHDNALNNSHLTCVTAGKHLVTGHFEIATGAGTLRGAAIRINGVTFVAAIEVTPVGGGLNTVFSIATVFDFIVGDFAEILALQNSGGPLNTVASADYTPEGSMIWLSS